MKTEIKERYGSYIHILTLFLFILSAYYMYDFYKALSGFIANQFREPMVMIPIFMSYFLPVFCFLFYFYDFYVGRLAKGVKIAYSAIVIILALFNLIGIMGSIDVYARNNELGVYDALLGVIIKFPYDAIIICVILLAIQVLNIYTMVKQDGLIYILREAMKVRGAVSLGKVEYILLCPLAILVFVFMGASICATKNAIQNMFYDMKFAFLIAWVFLVPLMNLLYLVIKPEKRLENKKDKIIFLSAGILANVLFFVLVLVLERVSPDYMVHLAKPIFTIAFSVSLPIEMLVLIGIMGISVIVFAVRLILATKSERVGDIIIE